MRHGFAAALIAAGLCAAAMPAAAVVAESTPAVAAYAPASGFPDRNGAFSAMLIVIPQQELAQFDTPGGGERKLSRVSRAESGAVLAIKLVFTGLAADSNGNGEVTYDLKVLAPDGKLYGDSHYRHLAAVRGPLGDGGRLFDNRSKVVMLTFEPRDMPGVYTIQAVARDEVAELEVPLQTTVELLAGHAASPSAQQADSTAPVEAAPAGKSKKKHRRKRGH